jgi:hypothetical protein
MKTGVAGAKATLARRARRAAWLAPLVLLAVPGLSLAHPERPSYWPNPRPDGSISPPAGGEVPQARSLASAVTGNGPGDVKVVCKGDQGARSLVLFGESLRHAQRQGFRLRPSQPKTFYSDERASDLLRINRALADQCRYQSVQRAINASGNNDRVVIMPGRYTESASRQAPSDDPRCAPDLYQTQANGDTAPSFEYQATCPNDQNLIYVQGREIAGPPPDPPLDNRQGIPASELGACKLCNFQIEGSGPRPEDVILDAGKGYQNPDLPGAKPGGSAGCDDPDDCYTKHVVLRADRADGFVAKNLLTRGGREFGIYTEEIDGYLLARTKFFWNADYGQLSFTSDHGLMRNCDGFGAGDAVVYPGAAPETGSQRDRDPPLFWPDAPRYNTTVTQCDLRGSALGYSGSMGNAVRITRNHIYGNVTGIASDTLSSAGHPGWPADSSLIDHNRIYSNNLDLYVDNPPVEPLVPVPLGTGIIYAGMNDALVHHNYIFDNWRFGSMLIAVPDGLAPAEGNVNPGISCPGAPESGVSTSCGNQFFDNVMGKRPPGFNFPAAVDQFGAARSHGPGYRNGTDFWWDEFPTNTGNCWFDNIGPDGTADSITGSGTTPAGSTPPDDLPSDCGTSVGEGDTLKEAYLLECSNGPDNDTGPTDCDWWQQADNPNESPAKREAAEHK